MDQRGRTGYSDWLLVSDVTDQLKRRSGDTGNIIERKATLIIIYIEALIIDRILSKCGAGRMQDVKLNTAQCCWFIYVQLLRPWLVWAKFSRYLVFISWS